MLRMFCACCVLSELLRLKYAASMPNILRRPWRRKTSSKLRDAFVNSTDSRPHRTLAVMTAVYTCNRNFLGHQACSQTSRSRSCFFSLWPTPPFLPPVLLWYKSPPEVSSRYLQKVLPAVVGEYLVKDFWKEVSGKSFFCVFSSLNRWFRTSGVTFNALLLNNKWLQCDPYHVKLMYEL